MSNPIQLKTYGDAVKAANQIIRLEAATKTLKEHLKAFVQNRGPVETDQMIFDLFPSESWSFSPDATKEMALAIAIEGTNPYTLLEFGAKNLKKIKSDLGWTNQDLEKFGTCKINESFRSKKKEDVS